MWEETEQVGGIITISQSSRENSNHQSQSPSAGNARGIFLRNTMNECLCEEVRRVCYGNLGEPEQKDRLKMHT